MDAYMMDGIMNEQKDGWMAVLYRTRLHTSRVARMKLSVKLPSSTELDGAGTYSRGRGSLCCWISLWVRGGVMSHGTRPRNQHEKLRFLELPGRFTFTGSMGILVMKRCPLGSWVELWGVLTVFFSSSNNNA